MPDNNSHSGQIAAASLIIILILLALGSIGLQRSGEVNAASTALNGDVSTGVANCRYGVAVLGDHQVDWIDDLGAGWYVNFDTSSVTAPNNAEFASVISVKQDKTAAGEYLPSYTTDPLLTDTGLGSAIDAKPGTLWIVGNEVDRGPNPGSIVSGQGDIFPEMYARAYHDVYHFIKNRDPSAQVANSALVEVTPGRLQYLDIMWDAYLEIFNAPMPVDVWNMHIYILPEVDKYGEPNGVASVALGTDPTLGKMEAFDPDGDGPLQLKDSCPLQEVYCNAEHDDMNAFSEQVLSMRYWMKEHGQQNKPLILSEFSILYPYVEDPGGTCFLQDEFGNCFTFDRVVNYLNNTASYLETATNPGLGYPQDSNRLVQQWLWFSVHHGVPLGAVSNLIDDSLLGLTMVGQAFRSAASEQATINLFGDQAAHPILHTATTTDTVDAAISISIRNNGNHTPLSSFSVAFYEDAALSQPIGSVIVPPPGLNQPGLTGCARRDVVVDTIWEGLSTGKHKYWAEIDGDGQIVESDESDNIISGFVLVNPNQSYVPAISK